MDLATMTPLTTRTEVQEVQGDTNAAYSGSGCPYVTTTSPAPPLVVLNR